MRKRERENVVAWAVRIDLAALRACRRLGSWRGPIGGLLLSLPLSRSLLFFLETYSRPPCPLRSPFLRSTNVPTRTHTHTHVYPRIYTHARQPPAYTCLITSADNATRPCRYNEMADDRDLTPYLAWNATTFRCFRIGKLFSSESGELQEFFELFSFYFIF